MDIEMTSSSSSESHFSPSRLHNSIGNGPPISNTLLMNGNLRKKGKADDDHKVDLPGRVSQWYYKHGLFLSSYPTCATSIAIAVILFCCYPLLNVPLPGTIPTKVIFPYTETVNQNIRIEPNITSPFNFNANHIFNFYNISFEPPFPWARIDPLLYVQQIILRTSVAPWEEKLQLTDAFRGPLHEIFKLIEIIRNHEDEQKTTLSHLCLHVENVKRPAIQSVFPEYNCLILSPANMWQQNLQTFNKDNNLLNTIFVHHNLHKSKVSTAEMLFGINLRETGIKRHPFRVRSRIIQYAVTLILKENNEEFLNSLKEKLIKVYPLHQNENRKPTEQSSIMYIFYPGEFNLREILPQCVAFLTLFSYVYFSIRKIDVIKSRLVLASSAVITVLGSLVMSLGLCFFFGLTISLQSKGIYPYLVILVGLENVLIITKSVVTTDNNLDVKIRVAQGLSKEGWSITKNLLTEITILTIGLATLVPVIQEFCIFAIVGLISDFFLQMLFFSTILAIDIKRIEYSDEVKQLPKMLYYNNDNIRKYTPMGCGLALGMGGGGMNRSRSHPKLIGLEQNSVQVNHLKKNSLTSSAQNSNKKIPKRLRIVNFWARTRFFQRGFMIWMVLWISNIIYTSGLIEQLFEIDKNFNFSSNEMKIDVGVDLKKDLHNEDPTTERHNFEPPSRSVLKDENIERILNITEQLNKLKHLDYETVYQLSNFHWSSILKQYNISLSGRYVTVLPAIKLSHPISPEIAGNLRNTDEKTPPHFQWKALAVALDPLDFNDVDLTEIPNYNTGNTPFYPKTPMEILLTTILIAVSFFFVAYTIFALYRCICSRNYAEWRASWNETESDEPKQEQRVLEGVPIQVNGHTHRIECLVTDGNMIASSCLQGQVKIWDITNGEFVAEIDRLKYFEMQQTEVKPKTSFYINNGSMDSITSGGMQEVYPSSHIIHQSPTNFISKLKNKITFNFSSQQQYQGQQPDPKIYDFKSQYQKYFSNHVSESDKDSDCRNRFMGIHGNSPNTSMQRSHSNEENPQQLPVKKIYNASPIWCLDFLDNLIVIGCADGRLEFWEGTTGNFKCIYETEATHNNGVTNIKLAGDKVIAARLSGRIDFLKLETYTQGRQIDWGFTSAYRRTHIRTGSAGSLGFLQSSSPTSTTCNVEELRCMLEFQQQGHQQPITCLEVVGSTVMTGSQDHTVKVFRLENHLLLYTLHGHCGPITSLFLDQWQSGTGGSGSQDGLLCVWDLITGACMYKIQAHEDSIISLTCSPSYVISLGLDEKLRIWERFQGHPLNTINVMHAYTTLLMLTPSLLVTGKPGALIVWDVRTGDAAREVKLDCSNSQLCPKIMLPANGSVICDYGSQMRIVRFPLVAADKCD